MTDRELRAEARILAEQAERIAPTVSRVPAVAQKFRKAFAALITRSVMSGGRPTIAVAGSDARSRAALATHSSLSSAERLDAGTIVSVQRWLRAWMRELGHAVPGGDQRAVVHYLRQGRVSYRRSLGDTLRGDAAELPLPLLNGLIAAEERAFESPKKAVEPEMPAYKHAAPAPIRQDHGSDTVFLPPDEPTFEGRLRLYKARGGSRELGARYAAQFLGLSSDFFDRRASAA